MPRALLLVALFAAGCGHAYSAAEAKHTLAGVDYSTQRLQPKDVHAGFASWAAVTDLYVAVGWYYPLETYDAAEVSVLRYASPHDAIYGTEAVPIAIVGSHPPRDYVRVRRGNLIFEGSARAVQAAIARLP
jgi:hypothetical protein